MAVKYRGNGEYTCLSGDTKPTTAPDDAQITETNTNRKYYFDLASSSWIRQELPTYQKFRIYKDGSNTVIINNVGHLVAGPSTDTAAVVQSLLDQMITGNIWEFVWDNIWWQLENPILFPSITTNSTTKKVIFRGAGHATRRATANQATLIEPTANFPDGDFLFSCQNQGDVTPKTSQIFIDGFSFYNSQPQGTKDVSGILLEAGNLNAGHQSWGVSNCFFNYIYTGLALRGLVWFAQFSNLSWTVSSVGWLGDACLEIGSGGHSGSLGLSPKDNIFYNMQTNSGDGYYNSFLDLTAGQGNYFEKFFLDGKYYQNAVLYLNNTDYADAGPVSYNVFRDIWTLDLEFPTPNNTLGNIYMHGGDGNVSSNRFINCSLSNYPSALRMDDVNVFKNEIELVARWGATANAVVNDTGSGQANTIVVRPGLKYEEAEEPITWTGGVSRIIDMRKESQNGGFTSVADGGTISHGLFATPLWVFVQASVAGEFASVTAKSSTTFTVALKTHANGAGTTQSVYWRAGVYA